MPIAVTNVTIAAGASLSGAATLVGNASVVGVIMPTSFHSTVVSVQISPDGTNFYDLCNEPQGTEAVFNVHPGSIVAINPDRLKCCAAIKLRSGTHDQPVVQTSACTFGIVTI